MLVGKMIQRRGNTLVLLNKQDELVFVPEDRPALLGVPAGERPRPVEFGERVAYLPGAIGQGTTWLNLDSAGETYFNIEEVHRAYVLLGTGLEHYHIWRIPDTHFVGLEHCAAQNDEAVGALSLGQRGTLGQMLMAARVYLTRSRHPRLPRLETWPGMPRYTVYKMMAGARRWLPKFFYTEVQAAAFAARLAKDENCETGYKDLDPVAPRYPAIEVADVLRFCEIVAVEDAAGNRQITWYDIYAGLDPCVVATAVDLVASPFAATVMFDGHRYQGAEAITFLACGRLAAFTKE